jgi:hypothetical protein
MSLRKTLVLALFVVAVGLFIFYKEIPREEAKRTEDLIFGTIKRNDVTTIEVKGPKGTFAMKRALAGTDKDDVGKWELTDPAGKPIEKAPVSTVLTGLTELKRVFTIPAEDLEADLDVYGLKDPANRATVQVKDKSVELLFGKLNDYKHQRYMQVAGTKDVFLTTNNLFTALDKAKTDFRDKSPIDFVDADLQAIELKTVDRVTRIENKGDTNWQITQPITATASSTASADIARALRNLLATRFFDTAGNDPEVKENASHDFGLAKPDAVIELKFKESHNPPTLTVSLVKVSADAKKLAGDDSEAYFQISGDTTIYGLKGDPTTAFVKPTEEYREKQLNRFATDTVTKATLTFGDKTLAIEKVIDPNEKDKYAPAKWTVNGKPGDADFIQQLFDDLSNSTAEKFPDPASIATYGFDKPTLTAVVILKGTKEGIPDIEQKLVIGNTVTESDKKLYYAQVNDKPEPFLISETTFNKLTPAEEKLLPVKAEEVPAMPEENAAVPE